MSLNDLVNVGLSDRANDKLDDLKERGIFAEKMDGYWDDVMASRITALLVDRQFPLPLAGVEAVDPWFSRFATKPATVEYYAVVHLVGRVCSRSDVSSALQGIEAQLDENGLWSQATELTNDEFEVA